MTASSPPCSFWPRPQTNRCSFWPRPQTNRCCHTTRSGAFGTHVRTVRCAADGPPHALHHEAECSSRRTADHRPRRPRAQPAERQRRAAARQDRSCSPACRARASRASPSTRSTPRASAATSRSLSSYARQFLGQMDKPDVDVIEGLSPAISIDQKSASRNPRSTVGTITEVYDYLRLLYARIGVQHCPNDGTRLQRQTPQQIVDRILEHARGHPVPGARAGRARSQGRVRHAARGPVRPGLRARPHRRRDGRHRRVPEARRAAGASTSSTRSRSSSTGSCCREGIERRLTDSLETALELADGVAEVELDRRARASEAEIADVQPAPRLPGVRHELRRAGAAQLLVQLAVRRVRGVRRPRHDVRGRPRAGHPRPRSVDRTTARSPRGAAPTRSTSQRMLESVAEVYDIDLDAPWEHAHRQAAEGRAARRQGQPEGQVQEPLRPQPRSTRPRTRA